MRRMMLGACWLVLAASPALAADRGGWSVLSGSAVGTSHLALHVQAGWPDLSLAGLYGVNDKLDVGGRIAFAYGEDGSLGYGPGAVPGFRIQATARYELLSSGVLRLGARFSPGFGLDFEPGLSIPRILLPVELVLGIVPSDALAIHVGLELPFYVTPGTFGGLTLPLLVGGGAEYHADKALAFTGQLRVGPALELTRPGAPSRFALEALVGLAYRI